MNNKHIDTATITETEKQEILMQEAALVEILQDYISETCWLCGQKRKKHPYICDSCTMPESICTCEER